MVHCVHVCFLQWRLDLENFQHRTARQTITQKLRFSWTRVVSVSCETLLASLPIVPHFCSLVCIQYNTRKWKSGESREDLGTLITWMTSGGREMDAGGRGLHSNNILDLIVEHSVARQDLRHSQDCKYSTWQVYCALTCSRGLPTWCPPRVHLTSFMWWVFLRFSLDVGPIQVQMLESANSSM